MNSNKYTRKKKKKPQKKKRKKKKQTLHKKKKKKKKKKKLKKKKKKQPHQKVGKGHEQTLLKRRHLCSKKTHEKMLIITGHQRNANQNHNEIPSHTPVRMAIIKKSGNNRVWRGCGEIGTLLHCWWDCKLVQSLWKSVWRFLKDLELEI